MEHCKLLKICPTEISSLSYLKRWQFCKSRNQRRRCFRTFDYYWIPITVFLLILWKSWSYLKSIHCRYFSIHIQNERSTRLQIAFCYFITCWGDPCYSIQRFLNLNRLLSKNFANYWICNCIFYKDKSI